MWHKKLLKKWSGPFKIRERVNLVNYRTILINGKGKPDIVHSDKLKPYQERDVIEPLFEELHDDDDKEILGRELRDISAWDSTLLPGEVDPSETALQESLGESSETGRPRQSIKVPLRYL